MGFALSASSHSIHHSKKPGFGHVTGFDSMGFAPCVFLVPRVENCQTLDFVIFMSKNLSSNSIEARCEIPRRNKPSLTGISTYQLPCTKSVAKG